MYKKLKRRKIIRNIIEGILCITFIVLTVIYIFKYKNSRIDKITEQVILGKVVGTEVTTTYNEKYSSIYFRFIMAFCVSLVILITDIICSGFIDISSKEDKIYIYKGLFLLGLYVNGELFEEKKEVPSMEYAGVAEDEIKLGINEYFVLGDNRNNSEDSRYANIGLIKKEHIVGKGWFQISPISDFGFID